MKTIKRHFLPTGAICGGSAVRIYRQDHWTGKLFERYGVIIVGVWRSKGWLRTELSRVRLREGDVLVMTGDDTPFKRISEDQSFLMLVPFKGEPKPLHKARLAGAIMLISTLVAALNVVPAGNRLAGRRGRDDPERMHLHVTGVSIHRHTHLCIYRRCHPARARHAKDGHGRSAGRLAERTGRELGHALDPAGTLYGHGTCHTDHVRRGHDGPVCPDRPGAGTRIWVLRRNHLWSRLRWRPSHLFLRRSVIMEIC